MKDKIRNTIYGAIVADALGNIEASCDGCMPGLAEMYQDYIDGKKELR